MFTMMAGLSSCSRDQSAVVAVLEEEMCRLTEINASNRAQLSSLRAEANRLEAAIFDLTATKSDLEGEVYSIQTRTRELRLDLSSLVKTGMEKDEFVAGARLASLGIGTRVYREVLVKQVTEHDVLISHTDGIARLKKSQLMNVEEAPFKPKPLDLATYVRPTPASMALRVPIPQPTVATPVSSQVAGRSSIIRSLPRYNDTYTKPKPRPKTVEVLAWWGPGSPYSANLTDAFGTKLRAASPRSARSAEGRPGPWLTSYWTGSSGRHIKGYRTEKSVSGYRPIGWNYQGSALDRIYGVRR